jgi:sulfate/thiosulfate transport system permease protein
LIAIARGRRGAGALPGFKLTLGFTLVYLTLLVLLPLAALVWRSSALGWQEFAAATLSSRALAAYRLTFGAALAAASASAVFGLVLAWVLVRYRFPGKRLIDGLVDLPFALPTAVAGITLTALLAPGGWVGRWLEPLGIQAAYTPLGVVIALIFIGLPFVVRTVQPVLEDIEPEVEEAAANLGAGRWQTFVRVLFPALWPALTTGSALAFARAVGEYGSVVFIAGNLPFKTEIAPLLIVMKLDQYDYAGATAIAAVLLGVSFLLLLGINALQTIGRRRMGGLEAA